MTRSAVRPNLRQDDEEMPFGQVIIGPPGAGKTTYCNGMQQFLVALGRKTTVVNLDPANESLPYDCGADVGELIKLEDVMNQFGLGPNGGLVYCMDYLEKNMDWLEKKLEPLAEDHYLLFDLPGQVELFTIHPHVRNIIEILTKKWNFRLTAVHLIDSHLCTDPGNYVSALLLSLSTMLHLALPHVNVLSKIDLIQQYGQLAFNLDFYTEVQDLDYLAHHLNQDPRFQKYRKLTEGLCDVIQDFGMVSFATLDINDKESVYGVVKLVDKSNGYVFAGIEGDVKELSKVAAGDTDWDYYKYPPLAASNCVCVCSAANVSSMLSARLAFSVRFSRSVLDPDLHSSSSSGEVHRRGQRCLITLTKC